MCYIVCCLLLVDCCLLCGVCVSVVRGSLFVAWCCCKLLVRCLVLCVVCCLSLFVLFVVCCVAGLLYDG